ncbi:MAG: peptidase, partial [Verrucomicrobia bacterium]
PETREQEPNDPFRPAEVRWPVIINGRIDRPGDADVFQFRGRQGQELVAEVRARRLQSPLDSALRLFGPDGALLAYSDDHDDPEAGLETHHADSYLRTTLPAEGTYRIQIEDVQRQGGPECAYRLRLSPPQPDFALRLTPSSLNARPGGNVPVTFHVVRRDGFTNRVLLRLEDAPPGFVFNNGRPAVIPPDKTQAKLTLRFPRQPLRRPLSLRFVGEARVQGRLIRHEAVPADDLMQAFIYRHLVPAQELLATTIGRPSLRGLAQRAVNLLRRAKPSRPTPK